MSELVSNHRVQVQDPPIAHALFTDTRFAIIWLVIRVYIGYQWLVAGYDKLINPAWLSGASMTGFVTGAVKLTGGAHPSVPTWYASFLSAIVLPYPGVWAYLIAFGEVAVGIGLILGLLTGFAAFFGGMMNANYLLSGTLSVNPLLFIFATWLVLAWRVAGYYGLDRWVLPLLGVPGQPGKIFTHDKTEALKPQAARAAS